MGFMSSIQNRSSVSAPEQWLVNYFGGSEVKSGVKVDHSSALTNATVFACVQILAKTIGGLPIHFYERLDVGKNRLHNNLYRIFNYEANPEMSAIAFREAMQGHLATWGNAYAEIEWTKGGEVKALWPLRPDKTTLERVKGKLYYKIQMSSGPDVVLPSDKVFHIPGFGFNGMQGYSVISYAKEAIGLGLAAEEFAARFYSNGANLGSVLKHPGKLGKDGRENLRDSWKEMNEGLSNSHRLAILEEGMDYVSIGIPQKDAQHLEQRKYQKEEIGMLYGIPPHMLGNMEKNTSWGTGIEQINVGLKTYTLMPWCERWTQTIWTKLIAPPLPDELKQKFFAEFLMEELLKGDIKSRYEAYQIARRNGIMNADEWRAKENMNPIEGGKGKTYIVESNMTKLEKVGEVVKPTEPKAAPKAKEKDTNSIRERRTLTSRQKIQNSWQHAIKDRAATILKRERQDVLGKAKTLLQRNELVFENWVNEFYEEHKGYIERQMYPLFRSYAEQIYSEAGTEIDADLELNQEFEDSVKDYLSAFATRHTIRSKEKVLGGLKEAIENGDSDLYSAVEGVFDEWDEEDRAQKIALNETVKGNGYWSRFAFIAGGLTMLRWQTVGVNCPACNALQGKVVGVEQNFMNAGDSLEAEGLSSPFSPSMNIGHPPLHLGCDCQISAG